MEKITVYRVEHADTHEGPYQVDTHLSVRMANAHTGDSLRPNPHEDGLGPWCFWPDDRAIFGCASLEALRQWFDGWEKELHGADYCISVYRPNTEDPGIWYGGKQVQFTRADFNLTEQLPLVDTDAVTV